MDKFVKVMGAAVLSVGGIFMLVCLGTLFGAAAGWIVGLFFGETILFVLAKLGSTGIAMWQFGAFMGFVGGFLKTKVSASS